MREEAWEVGEELTPTAAAGTGVALAGSAASSVIGFGVLSFAPMPMFSTYGILTSTMIFMAAGASLLVLPSLLMLAAPGGLVSHEWQSASTG